MWLHERSNLTGNAGIQRQLIEEIQHHAIDYLDPVSCGVMSPVTEVLLEKRAIPIVQQAQIIDLLISKRDLLRSMAKSCRGMVAWIE